MSHLLPSEKLEEQLPKLLPGVLALYRKHAETFHVSKVRACTPRPVQSSVHRPVPTWLRWEGVDTPEGKRRERCWTQWWVGPRHVSAHCPALPCPAQGTFTLALPQVRAAVLSLLLLSLFLTWR